MAKSKTPVVEQEEVKQEEVVPERKQVAANGLVNVHNPQAGHFVQPSSGIRIGGHETRELKDDGWLGLQLNAGVLKKV